MNYRDMHNAVLEEIRDIDIRKDHDYGSSFSNIYQKFGLLSSVIRLNDKMSRLETLVNKEAQVKDESIRDTLLDMANYCIKTIVELDKEKSVKTEKIEFGLVVCEKCGWRSLQKYELWESNKFKCNRCGELTTWREVNSK